ncbi:neural cell adhesion molecule 1-like isoform x5 [Plakobranchus ocellatus]|uniref:Neural cell adhesion molecule 1-like isoform x5 n=1 Tax=Plakobranchus ocellatus TaxID=259542 RepID=A0AAV4CHA0_9GAST|nr:neural cell adhesion molecule 1-like isoform x5 [Plakobranchus ocellatus]
MQGYFYGKSATCTCTLISDGYPKGQAQWYRGSQKVPGVSGGILDLTFNSSNPEQVYSCKGVSVLGKSGGKNLTAKFAFFEPDTVIIESASSTFDLCGDTNYTNNQLPTVCRVPKDKIYPAPTFSFSEGGLTFDVPQKGRVENMFYLRQFYPSPAMGGVYQVSCRATNTVTNKTQKRKTSVTFKKPPTLAPNITIKGKTYEGMNALNRITLAVGYTGDMTCRVEGGYPKAHTTQLTCGSLTVSGGENVATLTFQDDQLTKDMDGTECGCTSQHVTGCYNNNETNLTLDITYAPVITFTQDSDLSEFNVEDTPTFTCTAQGNPSPNLTLTRKRADQQLASVKGNLKTAELNHTMEPLDCLDTDVYVCSGENSQGVTTKESIVGVKCPQQLAPNISQPEAVEVAVEETAELGLEIYGYPIPHLLTLMRITDNTNLIGSTRHLIEYSPGQAPFGIVNVTIFFVEEEDFTNYTITVDNGEGEPLVYPFYLVEVNATVEPEKQGDGGDDNVGVAVGVTMAVLLVVVIAVVLLVLVLRRRAKNGHVDSRKSEEVVIINDVYATSEDVPKLSQGYLSPENSDEVTIPNPVYGVRSDVKALLIVQLKSGEIAELRTERRGHICLFTVNTSLDCRPVMNNDNNIAGRKNTFKNYQDVKQTITSATAAPTNMRRISETDLNPYEDVKGNEKPKADQAESKPKNKPPTAPKRQAGPKAADNRPRTVQVEHSGSADEPYAVVTLNTKGPRPQPAREEEKDDDFFPDPSTKPEVPDQHFGDEAMTGDDQEEQPYGNYKLLLQESKDSQPQAHSNQGFNNDEEESVYANTVGSSV